MLGRKTAPHHPGHSKSAPPPANAVKPAAPAREAGTAPLPAGQAAPWTPARFQVPPKAGATRFHDLHIPDPILHAIADLEFKYCTPIQAQILPALLAGRDAGGRAQTGTGKTAAFLIAIFTRLLRHPAAGQKRNGMPRALVIAPTRELVLQIFKDAQALAGYCRFRNLVVFGGMDYKKQRDKLTAIAPDLIVATPGRLLDFVGNHYLNLGGVEVMVIDEADRMLDMGFIPDVRRIVYNLPPKERRQTMLFSATLNQDIIRLAARWMRDPLMIEAEMEQVTVAAIDQRVYVVSVKNKFALLFNLLKREPVERVLVFRNRRDSVDRLTRKLALAGVACAQLSGEVPQEKRIRILDDFRAGKIRVVIATDVAGRGIHVEGISHVINYDVPEDAEDYVHRIGRTGRAGASGIAITFACEEGAFNIPAIEKFIGRALPCVHPADAWLEIPEALARQVAAVAVAHRPRPVNLRPGGQRRRRR